MIKFSGTPKMSSYLLAFIVGDFEYMEQKYTPPPKRLLATPPQAGGEVFVFEYILHPVKNIKQNLHWMSQ